MWYDTIVKVRRRKAMLNTIVKNPDNVKGLYLIIIGIIIEFVVLFPPMIQFFRYLLLADSPFAGMLGFNNAVTIVTFIFTFLLLLFQVLAIPKLHENGGWMVYVFVSSMFSVLLPLYMLHIQVGALITFIGAVRAIRSC